MRSAELFAGEAVLAADRYPVLTWHGLGSGDRPLLVLAPGGGHLGRIFYGHPGAEPADFLAHWLGELGYEVLVGSYASNHPANRAECRAMTTLDWAEDFAAAAAAVAGPGREVVLIGWSGAGQLAKMFRLAAERRGLKNAVFVGLAATAPLPHLAKQSGNLERVTPEGLWDSSSRDALWRAGLELQRQPSGREPISSEAYARFHRCDNPITMRSEPRSAETPPAISLVDVLERGRPFDWADYPLCASVTPLSPFDARHALTDRVTWGFINAQMAYCRLEQRLGAALKALDTQTWNALRARLDDLPDKLVRLMPGGHFFFVGEEGSRATAAHIDALLKETSSFNTTFGSFGAG